MACPFWSSTSSQRLAGRSGGRGGGGDRPQLAHGWAGGMRAAIGLRAHGLSVLVVDEQPAPGGQIWRAVEAVAPTTTGALLGEEYLAGADLASRFRSCGASYEPETRVWQVESGWKVYMTRRGQAESVETGHVILTMGAQERPAPFQIGRAS